MAAKLGRQVWLPHGAGKIFPNVFVMLVGVPGTRKSTSIKLAQRILRNSGYTAFSYSKTTKQKFLLDLEEGFLPKKPDGTIDMAKALEVDISSIPSEDRDPNQVFVCCDEFIDFIGVNNIEFINLLTTLWDNHDEYNERLKNSKSVYIYRPTISLLGGVTPTSFAMAMPKEVAGQGFLSRLIMVYGEPPERKVTWPRIPKDEEYAEFNQVFSALRNVRGEVKIDSEAMRLVDEIYQEEEPFPDIRLQYYSARRLTHMLKLCIILAALKAAEKCKNEAKITSDIVIEANTILTYTELGMSSALGEFGKSRNSEAMQKILEALSLSKGVMKAKDLWKHVSQDLERYASLFEILQNLVKSEKVQIQQCEDDILVTLIKRQRTHNLAHVDFNRYIPEYEERHERLDLY